VFRRNQQEGKSVNQHILETLKKSCGLEKEKKFTQSYQDMDHLFGKWSAEDFKRIQVEKISGLLRITQG
jgi:hypothetical protein